MNKIKAFKWATTLFHNYENKEYKERHLQEIHKENAIINILSNIINNPDLFSKNEVEAIRKNISNFHISEVEQNALLKIIDNPYPDKIFKHSINRVQPETKDEVFYTISDIFLSRKDLKIKEKSFIDAMAKDFGYSEKEKKILINRLKKSYQELKTALLRKRSRISRKSICQDICLSEYKNFQTKLSKTESYFETKKGIIGTVIFVASLINIKIDIPDFLLVLWAPSILYKTNFKFASYVGSNLITNYKRYEKVIYWNIVNLDRLIEECSPGKKENRSIKQVKTFTMAFASRIISHAFLNNEHKKISRFQRSLKN